jgi:hypothetical protein
LGLLDTLLPSFVNFVTFRLNRHPIKGCDFPGQIAAPGSILDGEEYTFEPG